MRIILPGDSSEEAEYWQAVTRIIGIGQTTFQNMQEAADCLCQEIGTVTGGRAQLVLLSPSVVEEKKGSYPALNIPVHHNDKLYGKLIVPAFAGHPPTPALPREVAYFLAALSGYLLHTFEIALYLQSQRARFDLTTCKPLTARETDIFRMMKQGLRDREIAQTLSIALDTVRTYRGNIYARLNVHSKQDALLVGFFLELL